MKKWIHIVPLCFLLFSTYFSAQTLASKLDKKSLALGEVGVFKMQITDVQGKTIKAAQKNELLPFHFEVIKDSIVQDSDVYIRTVEFAVYEEGKFTIPKLDVKVGEQIYHTVPYEIEVFNTAQKGDKINDILQNKETALAASDYWQLYKWYILAGLAFVALLIIIFYIIKYAKRQKETPVVTSNKTLKALENLKKKGYMENGNYRSFYVELLDISRDFITEQYRIPANVLLTDDLLEHLKQSNTISQQNEDVVERVFRTGDMVKFAKSFPTQEDMREDYEEIKKFVKRSVKDVELENLS